MNLAYILACSRAIADKYSGLNSFIDVFDTLTIPQGAPSTIQTFSVVAKVLQVDPGAVSFKVVILDPNNDVKSSVVITGDSQKLDDINLIAGFNFVNFSMKGKYTIYVEANGVKLQPDNLFYFWVK